MIERLAELARSGGRAVLFTAVDGAAAGRKVLVVEAGKALEQRHSTGSTNTSISPPQGSPTSQAISSVIP